MDYEIRANQYSFGVVYRGLLIILLTWVLNELGIFILDSSLMRKGVITTSILWIIVLMIIKKVGLDKWWVKYVLAVALAAGIYILYTFISYHLLMLLGLPFIVAAQYSSKRLTTTLYIFSIICMLITLALNYEYGLCDMNMVGLTTSTAYSYGEQAVIDVKRLDWGIYGKLILYYGLTRAAVLSFYVFIAHAIVRNASDMMQLQTRTEQEGKTDAMTGLNNRNEYLRAIKTDYMNNAHVGVIYIDINGLKEINDTYGHEKGDELIVNLSKSISIMLEDDVKGYRVGGDEFVLIMENASGARLMMFQERWLEALEKINEDLKTEYRVTAAYGYAYGKGNNIIDIIEEADKKMYEQKKKMKQEL